MEGAVGHATSPEAQTPPEGPADTCSTPFVSLTLPTVTTSPNFMSLAARSFSFACLKTVLCFSLDRCS